MMEIQVTVCIKDKDGIPAKTLAWGVVLTTEKPDVKKMIDEAVKCIKAGIR